MLSIFTRRIAKMKFIRIDRSISTFVLSLKRIRIAGEWMDTKKPIHRCSYCFFDNGFRAHCPPLFPWSHAFQKTTSNIIDAIISLVWTFEIRSRLFHYMLKYLLLLRICFKTNLRNALWIFKWLSQLILCRPAIRKLWKLEIYFRKNNYTHTHFQYNYQFYQMPIKII